MVCGDDLVVVDDFLDYLCWVYVLQDFGVQVVGIDYVCVFVWIFVIDFVVVEQEWVVGFQLVKYDLFEQIDGFYCLVVDMFIGYQFGIVVVEVV